MLQSPVNKTVDEKLIFVEFEHRLFRKNEEGAPPRLQVRGMKETMLNSQHFIAPGVMMVKKET